MPARSVLVGVLERAVRVVVVADVWVAVCVKGDGGMAIVATKGGVVPAVSVLVGILGNIAPKVADVRIAVRIERERGVLAVLAHAGVDRNNVPACCIFISVIEVSAGVVADVRVAEGIEGERGVLAHATAVNRRDIPRARTGLSDDNMHRGDEREEREQHKRSQQK